MQEPYGHNTRGFRQLRGRTLSQFNSEGRISAITPLPPNPVSSPIVNPPEALELTKTAHGEMRKGEEAPANSRCWSILQGSGSRVGTDVWRERGPGNLVPNGGASGWADRMWDSGSIQPAIRINIISLFKGMRMWCYLWSFGVRGTLFFWMWSVCVGLNAITLLQLHLKVVSSWPLSRIFIQTLFVNRFIALVKRVNNWIARVS